MLVNAIRIESDVFRQQDVQVGIAESVAFFTCRRQKDQPVERILDAGVLVLTLVVMVGSIVHGGLLHGNASVEVLCKPALLRELRLQCSIEISEQSEQFGTVRDL